IERPQNKPATEFQLETRFRVTPGSLPRLRYGKAYRMRARAVDLAGNSRPMDIAEDVLATAPRVFYRAEAVPPTVVVLRGWLSEGESLEHMVIRSNIDVAAAGYGAQPYVVQALQGQSYSYDPENERHLSPPKTSQLMAELHGKFEEAIG